MIDNKWEEKEFGIILSETFHFLTEKGYVLRTLYNDKECVGLEFINNLKFKKITFILTPSSNILIKRFNPFFLLYKDKNSVLSMKQRLNLNYIYDYREFIIRSLEHIKDHKLL